jgi:hypothetical protein
MSVSQKMLNGLVFGLALSSACCTGAAAEEAAAVASAVSQASTPPATSTPVDETSDSKWHFYSTGYLWFPGMHGTVGVLGRDASVHVSPVSLLSNFNFGIMGAFTPTYNRFSAPFDYIWIRLKDSKAIPFNPAYSIQAKVTESILTPKVAYLLVNNPKVRVYGTAGIRYWHLGNNLSIQPSNLGLSRGQAANWVDFVAGGRFAVPLSPKVSVDVLGDAGGGGAGLDYQVAGFANYQWKPKITLQGGWRYLTVHFQGNNQFINNTSMSGLIFGATYKFK